MIGKFYIAIDSNLQVKGCRPDNTYRFIERLVTSSQSPNAVMHYGVEDTEVKGLRSKVEECSKQIQKLSMDVRKMKQECEKSKKKLDHANFTLKEEIKVAKDHAYRQTFQLQKSHESMMTDFMGLVGEIEDMKEKNFVLSHALKSAQSELATFTDATTVTFDDASMNFIFETKSGDRKYSSVIRTLYYTLLADQISPAKISNTIKSVLKSFLPGLDVEHLQLPKERCAGYMRAEEMNTVSMAHKASLLCEKVRHGPLHANTDGTTLQQKKLGGIAISDVVVSVNELADGTAETTINDVSKELRATAHALGISNADSINWTLLASSSSDSASTQKRFNKLMQECIEADREKFGMESSEATELVENFCGMHLGSSLRKAFLSGMTDVHCSKDADKREHHPVDVFVHEFCKLFGRHGTPEYGCGGLAFPDFLVLTSNDPSMSKETLEYY